MNRKPENPKMRSTILIREYNELAKETDRLPPNDVARVLFGLFGEVGGIMTADKKHRRGAVG